MNCIQHFLFGIVLLWARHPEHIILLRRSDSVLWHAPHPPATHNTAASLPAVGSNQGWIVFPLQSSCTVTNLKVDWCHLLKPGCFDLLCRCQNKPQRGVKAQQASIQTGSKCLHISVHMNQTLVCLPVIALWTGPFKWSGLSLVSVQL